MKRALLLGVTLAVTVPTGAARAGSYVVHACGAGDVNNAWHATPPPPGVMEANEACHADPQMDGIWVRDVLASPTDLTDGQGAWLQFDAPTGTTITAITYKRWLWKDSIDDLHPELRTAEGTVLETCSIPYGNTRCDVGGEGTDPVTYSGLSTTRLQAGVRCQVTAPFTGCTGGGTEHGYGAAITDAAVTIEDDAAPATPNVAASGLWSGASWYRGTSFVTVSGGDASGIAAVRAYADGQLLDTATPACDYTLPKPCQDATDLQVPVDTAQLADGEHDLAVTLVDAAGNESPTARTTVLVANDPPGTPQLTLTPTQSDSPSFTASWTPAPGHLLPIALAHVTVCHDVTCSHTTSTASSVQLSAPGPGATTIFVYLEDLAGNADPDNAAEGAFSYTPPQPPAGAPTPPGGPPPSKPTVALSAAHLRVFTEAKGSRVRVGVMLAKQATGRIMLRVRWQRSGAGRSKGWTHWRRYLPSIRHGRVELTLTRPRRARRVQVVASYGGDVHVRRASARIVRAF